jgi:hypothetical protein
MRKFALAALTGVVLSLAACQPTDDAGDPLPVTPTHSATPRVEGDTAFPSVMATPHVSAKSHKLKRHR